MKNRQAMRIGIVCVLRTRFLRGITKYNYVPPNHKCNRQGLAKSYDMQRAKLFQR